MVIELEKVLYEYLKTLIEDIKKNVEEEKTTREEMVQTSLKGLSINLREYKIKDGVYKGLYVYISDYVYDNNNYEGGDKEKRTEICITSIDQFEKVKNCKRRFSPTYSIQDCSFLVFENRAYQRDSISFMIKETPKDSRYVYRITESQKDNVYEAICEENKPDPNGEKKYEESIKPENADIIKKLVMPKLQLYGKMMVIANYIKKAILKTDYIITGQDKIKKLVVQPNKTIMRLTNGIKKAFLKDGNSNKRPNNGNSNKGPNNGNSNKGPNRGNISQEDIFNLMCIYNKGRVVEEKSGK